MSVSMYQSSIKRLQDDVADLRKKLGELSKKKADIIGDISRTQQSIAQTKSLSTLRSKQSDLKRLYDKLGDIEKRQSDLEKKLAYKTNEHTSNQTKLNKALEDEEKKRARERKSQLDKELKQAQSITAELNRPTSPLGQWAIFPTPLLTAPNPEESLIDRLRAAFPKKRPGTLETFIKIIEEYEKYERGEYESLTHVAQAVSLELSTFYNYLGQLRDKDFLPNRRKPRKS